MKKTKIVVTIGPSCMDYNIMKGLVVNGANVFRINLSHARRPDMDIIYNQVKQIRKELNVPLPIMIDTRGPELRVKTFKNGGVLIKRGQTFTFTGRVVEGDEKQVSLNMPEIVKEIKAGQKILANDGLLVFKVTEVKGQDIIARAVNSGNLSNRKSLFVPNVDYNTPYLNEADKNDILWAIEKDCEYIAASFVNTKNDVAVLREFITANGGDMKIISKIESARGVKNLDEIIDASDAIMVARGDLGVELPVERLPDIQKTMIDRCNAKGKPVITATEMLESMINNNRPTRAEVSDIANAVYDGTSAVMLSGETASGKHPVEAVRTMAHIAKETEKHIDYHKRFLNFNIAQVSIADAISHSAVDTSFYLNTKAIVVFTSTGYSAGAICRFQPTANIIGATPNEKVYRQLDLFFGVIPVKTKMYNSTDAMFNMAKDIVKQKGFAKEKDTIIITCGVPKQNGCTNLIKVTQID